MFQIKSLINDELRPRLLIFFTYLLSTKTKCFIINQGYVDAAEARISQEELAEIIGINAERIKHCEDKNYQ